MAIRSELSFQSADEVTTIQGYCWKPDGRPKGIVHICHGMVEYIERYDAFANELCEHGYVVYGADMLGHGRSVVNKKCFGYFGDSNGNWKLISDIVILQGLAKREYPGIPYYILGHSFGSLLVREFVERFPDMVDGMILVGVVDHNSLVAGIGKLSCEIIAHTHKDGYRYRSTFINDMTVGGFDKNFRDENLRNSWLSKDRENIANYNSKPECNFIFTVGAYRDMMNAFLEANKKKNLERLNKDMPILILAGTDDPAGDFGRAPKHLYRVYKDQEMDCRMRLYKGNRHEVLLDVDKQKVYMDIIKWLNYYTK